jgi:hypothetical protein
MGRCLIKHTIARHGVVNLGTRTTLNSRRRMPNHPFSATEIMPGRDNTTSKVLHVFVSSVHKGHKINPQ